MAEISRDPLETGEADHQRTSISRRFCAVPGHFVRTHQDRDVVKGSGFTHKEGDVVRISTPKLGVLENRVTTSKAAPPWNFGISDLMKNLVRRGLLSA